MERYVYLDDISDLRKIHRIKKKIGEGSEGAAYLTQSNKVLKIYNGFNPSEILDGEKDSIVMAQDYNVASYLFPEQLYICKGVVVGYLSKYFKNNKIHFCSNLSDGDFKSYSIKTINFDKLLEAREKMIEDTRIITNNKVSIQDLCFNLLFDGNKLGAIDTMYYHRDPNITLDENISKIDYALLNELRMHDSSFDPDLDLSLEQNVKMLRR